MFKMNEFIRSSPVCKLLFCGGMQRTGASFSFKLVKTATAENEMFETV